MMDERAAHGSPFVFLKAPSAITGPFDPVVLPAHARQPDWELELAAIIGKPARRELLPMRSVDVQTAARRAAG